MYHAIADNDSSIIWVTGGLGSGKTYGAVVWFIQRCFLNYRSRFSWAVAPTHTKAEDILIPTFLDVLSDVFGQQPGRDFVLTHGKPPMLRFKDSGHTTYFHSGNKPEHMVGTNISHWLITEAGTQKREVYERCETRTRCPKATIRQGLGEGTPEGLNWYADVANFDEYDHERKYRRFITWSDDNPHLPHDYIERRLIAVYGRDPAKLQSYRYGLFVPFTRGTAYWEFFHSRNVVSEVAPSLYLPLILSFDFNKSPLAWVALQQQPHERNYHRVNRFVALAESKGDARGLLDACADFIAQFPPDIWRDVPIYIHGDPTGYHGSHKTSNCDFDQIQQYLMTRYTNVAIQANRKAPRIRARLERINGFMAYERFVVAAHCRNLINSFAQTCLKDGTFEIEKPTNDTWTHYADAAGYPIYQLTKEQDLEDPTRERTYGINA